MDLKYNTLKKTAYSLVAVGASVGLVACGGAKQSSPDNSIRIENGVLYVPGESEGKASTYHCEGTELEQTLERKSHAFEDRGGAADETNRIVGDPICADGVISSADFSTQP